MNALGLDTSADACSCAVRRGQAQWTRHVVAPRQHSELALAMIEELLTESNLNLQDLSFIAVGCGPGSFTGVRIAVAVAQGLGFAADLPVIPVSSLQALAQGVWRESGSRQVLTAFDARMDEVYWGSYTLEGQVMTPTVAEQVCPPAAVPVPETQAWVGAGAGFHRYAQALAGRLGHRLQEVVEYLHPHALDVLELGLERWPRQSQWPAEAALPVYLRDQVAQAR